VNDCSPDPLDDEICKEYTKKDDRIKYIKHKENLGIGSARNTGIKNATAKYIGSVDSDDWVENETFKKLYETANSDDWDVVICGFKKVNMEGKTLSIKNFEHRKNLVYNKDKDIFKISNPAFWNKLWKKSLYTKNNIFFPEDLYFQDLATTPRIYYYAEKIAYIDDILFNYFWTRENSTSFSTSEKHITDHFKVFDILKNFLCENNCFDLYKDSFFKTVFDSISFHLLNSGTILEKKQYQDYIKLFFKEYINWHKTDINP
jgi:glycosyltransferase involved in cell wall biosynthesis